MKNYELIIEFLKTIGAEREAKRYVKLFQRGDPARFAVIKLGGSSIAQSEAVIGVDLAYLCRLGLFPIVIHGAGLQIDQALTEAGLKYRKIDGKRVTAKKHLLVIRKTLDRVNDNIVAAIEKYGGSALGLTRDIFIAEPVPDRRFGCVGQVRSVDTSDVLRAIRSKKIPVVSCLGSAADGRYYNINADEAAKTMVLAVKPKKYIIITDTGGIRDGQGKVIARINLSQEMSGLVRSGLIRDGMLLKAREAKALLEKADYALPIQITSGRSLLRELFTDAGDGTFIKLGSAIREYTSWQEADKYRARNLIEKSFDRVLKREYFSKPVARIFVDRRYRALSIVRKVDEMYYLDKFCVTRSAQGEGIGGDIWFKTVKKFPRLFWRSRVDNPVNGWYFEKSDGGRKFEHWVLFWINLSDDQVKRATRYILNLDESFLSKP
jgi:acetylglutamate kinase